MKLLKSKPFWIGYDLIHGLVFHHKKLTHVDNGGDTFETPDTILDLLVDEDIIFGNLKIKSGQQRKFRLVSCD